MTTQEQLEALRKTWRDRFGVLPEGREFARDDGDQTRRRRARMSVVEVRDDKVMLTRNGAYVQIDGSSARRRARIRKRRLRECSSSSAHSDPT